MMMVDRNNNLPDQINQNLANQVVEVQPEATSTPKVHTVKPMLRSCKAKIIKQRCVFREWGRGEGDFFFGLAIYLASILYKDLTVYNSRQPKQEAFWRDGSTTKLPTTYMIIVNWWQHHQTKLPMARIFYKYMQTLLQIYDLNAVNVVIKIG
jgi:hypothetical protein